MRKGIHPPHSLAQINGARLELVDLIYFTTWLKHTIYNIQYTTYNIQYSDWFINFKFKFQVGKHENDYSNYFFNAHSANF